MPRKKTLGEDAVQVNLYLPPMIRDVVRKAVVVTGFPSLSSWAQRRLLVAAVKDLNEAGVAVPHAEILKRELGVS